MRAGLAVMTALILVSPAHAAGCPNGQIERVHLHRCVAVTSALAKPYFHRARFVARVPVSMPPHRPPTLQRIDVSIPVPALEPVKPKDIDPRTPEQMQDKLDHDVAVQMHKVDINKLMIILHAEEGD